MTGLSTTPLKCDQCLKQETPCRPCLSDSPRLLSLQPQEEVLPLPPRGNLPLLRTHRSHSRLLLLQLQVRIIKPLSQ